MSQKRDQPCRRCAELEAERDLERESAKHWKQAYVEAVGIAEVVQGEADTLANEGRKACIGWRLEKARAEAYASEIRRLGGDPDAIDETTEAPQ